MNITTGKPFADGEHILYVNGEYRGDSDIGKLMHDFNCTDADDMNFKLMADRTRYLKENRIRPVCVQADRTRPSQPLHILLRLAVGNHQIRFTSDNAKHHFSQRNIVFEKAAHKIIIHRSETAQPF